MPVIRANREAVDDRFSVLGFTVRTESPLFEVAIATDPALFRGDQRRQRSRSNFYSSRASGALRARRGEAVYLVPPDVLANFVGQPKLYFGLATYAENTTGRPNHVQPPSEGNMYVNIAGLTPRGLRRLASRPGQSSYGQTNGHDPSLDWGGDALSANGNGQAIKTNGSNGSHGTTASPANGNGNGHANGTSNAPYDDGFGPFPAGEAPADGNGTAAKNGNGANGSASAQSWGMQADDPDAAYGIEGPIPDATPAQKVAAQALTLTASEYPQASRFVAAAQGNYRVHAEGRNIERIVIHITDGGANIAGPISWFQNPEARVSAHYIIGQDGEVVQMVAHKDVAWHAGRANGTSIGIEHVANTRGLNPTESQYQASAALVAWLCRHFNVPVDREHVLGHAEADTQTTHRACPNAVWNWEHFMALLQAQQTPSAQALEIIEPFYDSSDPNTALMCTNDAFSLAREEWFVGVDNTRSFPHSAICQLKMTAPDGSRYSGTGFYIGRNRILTCAHNLHGMSSVTIIPGRNGSGGKPFGEVTVSSSSWRIAPGYTGSGNWANDLAVIDNVSLAAPNGKFFEFLMQTPSDQLPIVVCGYSAGSRTVPALNRIIDGDKQHLHGGYAHGQSDFEVIEYPILTLMGASGSPVYTVVERSGQLKALICAVHVTGQPAAQGLNRGCFITPNKIDWIEGRATSFALGHAKPQRQGYQRPTSQAMHLSRAQGIPLDPGEGGMSIGVDALQAGDIIVSTARHVVSYAIRVGTLSAVSHAMLYVGDGKIIDAVGNGVREIPLADAIGDALIAVAYRDPRVDSSKASAIVAHARSRVGSPYNYAGVGFTGYRILNPGRARLIDAIANRLGLEVGQAGAVYCSELVWECYQQAGVPLSDARPAESRPSDIVDLFGTRLNYVGHLLAEDVPLGIPLALSRNRYPRALSNAFSVHWDDVPYQPQSSNNSCWAASAAMVVGWRDRMSIPDSEIAAKVPALNAYRTGLWPRDRQKLADVWNLVAEAAASYTVDAWKDMLQRYGPIYIDMTATPSGGGHARVLVGIESDGNADGSGTTMYMYDPWPSSKGRIKLSFAQFLALYEGRTENSGGQLEYQILHSESAPIDSHPVTSAPFALQDDATVLKEQNGDDDLRKVPPPEPIVQQQQLRARAMEGATVAIASVVAGAVMERLVNNEGDINWELDQLRGFKHPNDTAPSPLPAAHDGQAIRLTDWPKVENLAGDEISAGFEINWQYNGKSVGNVLISNVATNDAIGQGLIIKAKIMDDNIVYPRDNPTFAALRIRFEYRFTRSIGNDWIAIRDVHLFGNGRYNISGRWEQT